MATEANTEQATKVIKLQHLSWETATGNNLKRELDT